MTKEQSLAMRARVAQLKQQSDMCLAAVTMLERNLRELVQQLHILHKQMQEES